MSESNLKILTVNAGSSSIKIALYEIIDVPVLKLSGQIENIGSKNSAFIVKENDVK